MRKNANARLWLGRQTSYREPRPERHAQQLSWTVPLLPKIKPVKLASQA